MLLAGLGMAGGQCLDIEAEGKELGLTELQALHSAKTGALIRVSVQLGALSTAENIGRRTVCVAHRVW